MSDTLLARVLSAIEIVVIECLPDLRYRIVGESPHWLKAAFDEASHATGQALGGALPFLEQFLDVADRAWDEGGAARADSGPFAAIVKDEEILLRAAAITVDDRCVLVIERLTGDADTRPILQKAREQQLATEELARQAAGVHGPASEIAGAAAALSAVDLAPAARAIVERLRSASSTLQSVAERLPTPPSKRRPVAGSR